MNSERPSDPREQMEVRITALLLGEASPFEEAELLEAIKSDPGLQAYYEEMRGIITIFGETVLSAPIKKGVKLESRPVLDEKRRGRLQKLFERPKAEAIKLDTARNVAHRKVFLKNLTALAAGFVMLGVSIWIFVSGVIKPRPNVLQTNLANGRQLEIAFQMYHQSATSPEHPLSLPKNREDTVELFGRERQRAQSVQMNGFLNDSLDPQSENSAGNQVFRQPNVEEMAPANGSDRQQIVLFDKTSAESRSSKREATKIFLPQQSGPESTVENANKNFYFGAEPTSGLLAGQTISRGRDADPRTWNFSAPETDRLITDFKKEQAALPPVERQLRERPLERENSRPSAAFGENAPALADIHDRATTLSSSSRGARVLMSSKSLMVPAQNQSESRGLAAVDDGEIRSGGLGGRGGGISFGNSESLAISQPAPKSVRSDYRSKRGTSPAVVDETKDDPFAAVSLPAQHADRPMASPVAPGTERFDVDSDGAERLGEVRQLATESVGKPVSRIAPSAPDRMTFHSGAEPLAFAEGQVDAKKWVDPPPPTAPIADNAPEGSLGLAMEPASRSLPTLELESKAINPPAPAMNRLALNDAGPTSLEVEELARRQEPRGPKALTPIPGNVAGKEFASEKPGHAVSGQDHDAVAALPASTVAPDSLGLASEPAASTALDFVVTKQELNSIQTSDHEALDILAAKPEGLINPTKEAVEKRVEQKIESLVAPPVQASSLEPRPEVQTAENAFSTFSLNISDVSFKLAQASLENGELPDGKKLRSEEFINAMDYHDPAPLPGQKLAFHWERARFPFAFGRDLLRFSIQTAAAGRQADQPLNLVVLLDNSGSMERSDRVEIIHQMLAVLADQLHPNDRISVISFARTARLWVDGLPGGDPAELLRRIGRLNPEGGTNLEDALRGGYEIARKHYNNYANNRVILLTDGAANLGNVDPEALHKEVVEQRQRGIALDCFGVGWEGYNDNLLEVLSRNGDGRYGFINRPEDAATEFANLLAGSLQVAAADVKAQVELNPERVVSYRQIGYLQHQLTKEQFRDNTVDAAEIGAAEAGNALYVTQINPNGSGPIGTVRVRYRVPATGVYEEREWVLPYNPVSTALKASSPAMKLAATSASFAEWLAQSPHAAEVTLGALQNLLNGVPEAFAPDTRPQDLQRMIQATRSISGQ